MVSNGVIYDFPHESLPGPGRGPPSLHISVANKWNIKGKLFQELSIARDP